MSEGAGSSNIHITLAKGDKASRTLHVTNVTKLPDDEPALEIYKQAGVSLGWPTTLDAAGVKLLWERAVRISGLQNSPG
eukprot:1374249-Pyramimonas_sp.AAC.1